MSILGKGSIRTGMKALFHQPLASVGLVFPGGRGKVWVTSLVFFLWDLRCHLRHYHPRRGLLFLFADPGGLGMSFFA